MDIQDEILLTKRPKRGLATCEEAVEEASGTTEGVFTDSEAGVRKEASS